MRRRPLAAVCLLGLLMMLLSPPAARASVLPSGFQESTVFSGLVNPTNIEFARDGRVFVAQKNGQIKVFDNANDSSPDLFADLSSNVHDFWDRGLLGMALHPDFPTTPYVYVLYTYDAPIGGSPPTWRGRLPQPAGGDRRRLRRLRAAVAADCQRQPDDRLGAGVRQRLVPAVPEPLHRRPGLRRRRGPVREWRGRGQLQLRRLRPGRQPLNPCGDPPGGVGGVQTPPSAEGGALRSQDLRTPADPTSLDGAVLRLDPGTGAAMAGNPLAGSADPKARMIVAHGLRNPFRMTVRPGTSEIWLGNVGWNTWEEIDRIQNPTAAVRNFGWPCYEGGYADATGPSNLRQGTYDNDNLSICENLYGAGAGAVTSPWYAWNHSAQVVSGETCPTGGSSAAGVAFYPASGGGFPADYAGALFFADYSRDCIWAMKAGADGLPNPGNRVTFAAAAANPVDLEVGPDGALWYADLNGGTVRRIQYFSANRPPVAVATASPASGPAPLTVTLDGSGSSDPDPGNTLSYAWDLDEDGLFDDATGATVGWTFQQPGTYTPDLRVTDNLGASDTDSVTVTAGNTPPTATITSPASTLRWKVGDTISFSGGATDQQDGTEPASRLSWSLVLQHCAIGGGCHAHPLQSFSGVASGSFTAPDHEYPAYLELTLTATDAGGLTDRKTVRLDPQTVDLGFQTSPPGLQLTVGSAGQATPFTRTVIVGSNTFLNAPSPQSLGGLSYGFQSWSDGGAQGHFITAPATPATLTATYQEGWVPHARINFQPAGAPVPAGYLADTGAAFGSRGNGFSYGWSGAKRTARDRNSVLSPDQRYDTLIEMEKGSKTATWELAVPNGIYRVHLVGGDPVDLSGTYRLNVEGQTAINGTLTSSNRWLEATVTVTVSDGRLTVAGAAGANGNKVNYLDIERPG